jgi:hypothetical protein
MSLLALILSSSIVVDNGILLRISYWYWEELAPNQKTRGWKMRASMIPRVSRSSAVFGMHDMK